MSSAIKKFGDWWLPAHEMHLQPWMAHPKNRNVVLNGRVAYQGKKQLAVLDLCRNRRVAVDVGAHCGLWSYNLAHAFGQVHAFEPMAVHRDCFIENTILLTNIVMHKCALGEQQGMVRLESEKGSSGNTKIVGAGDIELRTLDSFELQDVDLIKLDCEGYELHVLRGAAETIKRCRPVIIVEQKRTMAEEMGLPKHGAVTFLTDQGYSIAREMSGDFLMIPP